MSTFEVSYKNLCDVLINPECTLEQFLSDNYPSLSDEDISLIISSIKKKFVSQFQRRLQSAHRVKTRFLEKYSSWLEGVFKVDLPIANHSNEGEEKRGGRPDKAFEDCCPRAQSYKVKNLRETHSQSLIDAASSLPEISVSTFDADSALALIIQAKLSKYQYEIIRKAAKDIGHDIFPNYHEILGAKAKCYPENILVTESSAEVPLQELLNHTIHRLLSHPFNQMKFDIEQQYVLHTKWGCDGASGQSEYMQRFDDPNVSDSNLFLTSIVPLKITLQGNPEQVVWKNLRPSSTRYCRPVKFEFIKETPEIIRREKNRIESEIGQLHETIVHLNGSVVKIHHKLYFTMIDGKVAQIATDTTSSSNCVVCGATPSEMNSMSKIQSKQCSEKALMYGLSPLHARIRFMEYILHLSYNLDFKAWRTTKETRLLKEETKKRIQSQFKEQLGLKVDFVRQGTGTTNSGNTSRRFFTNPSIVSDITKIDRNLIERLAVILEVLNSDCYIDPEKFGIYARQTAELAMSIYSWYHLPTTVHRILFHGKQTIEHAALPIGSLSEEAQESRNKDYKYYRTHHSRKTSRLATNEDVFHVMMISSDPYISYLRPEPKVKSLPLSDSAKALLK